MGFLYKGSWKVLIVVVNLCRLLYRKAYYAEDYDCFKHEKPYLMT